MNKIIYPSRIKDTNLGDVLINALLIRELSNYGEIYFDGEIPSLYELVTINNHFRDNIIIVKGIKSFEGLPVVRWVNLAGVLSEVSFIFDPPGAYAEGKKGLKGKLKIYKYYVRAWILKRAFNIGVLRWGVSMGPFTSNGLKRQQMLSKVYKDIAVRDSKNYEYLESNGFANISLIDDLAFLYEQSDFQSLISLDSSERISGNYIVISLRGDIEGKLMNIEYLEGILKNLIRLLKDKFSGEYQLMLAYQVSEDLESLIFIKNGLENIGINCSLINNQLNFEAAIRLYANADFVITNRLHVALLAILNNTVPLIITNLKEHHKLVNIFADLGLDELLIGHEENAIVKFDKDSESMYLKVFNDYKIIKAKIIRDHFSQMLQNKY